MALGSIKQLKNAIFYSKEKPELLLDILFPIVRDVAVATTVFVKGDATLTLDKVNNVTTSAPIVTVFDQYDLAISSPTVSFAIKTSVTGCTVNSSTGVLTATKDVTPNAKPVIVATCGQKTAELTVTILVAPEEEE